MISDTVIELSRWQFAITALYHFLFVPLTIGLAIMLAIMESVYVMTGRPVYRQMVMFWGKLFGINFALGVATGITMEFQFGTNWSYYSQYVGDIFGTPLAIEGLMAFFLESTFVGLFFFGWDRLSRLQHLLVTWLVALGSNFSALWILIANAWMQNPVGAHFNPDTLRMELASFSEVFFNPVAQVKFVHTVSAAYVTAACFVLGISAWYLLRNRHRAFALRSFAIASAFGLASVLSVITLGDESGYEVGHVQKVKLAAIEAMWQTHPPPAPFTAVGLIDSEAMETRYAVEIPWLMGLIATRSIDTPIAGIRELTIEHEAKIRNGIKAYAALQKVRENPTDLFARQDLLSLQGDLGYGLLVKRYAPNVIDASDAQIAQAARDAIPPVGPLFWAFRIMVGCGVFMLVVFVWAFFASARRSVGRSRTLLKLAVAMIPVPWIASELGWIVAELGRQPWTVSEVLPTWMSVSSLTVGDLLFSLTGFVVFYTALLVVEMYLMVKFARKGPAEEVAPSGGPMQPPPGRAALEAGEPA
ncbi:MAG TPA: cytochrome ubiquinol oxidase subunit I [Dokdonella sp.]|uniref:cytochrome ubiquinol oxidase subunit I n=1 Tax=Dokdonella sp. TaxID=2291710 RepID=UPI002C272B3F|nr:cytochrome ubiquinol oxidase subunit I [Dokdonella sp.]HUD42141.1 cytochrome ubiquinol oxidase subunit I [Dokdonella sp.]